MWFGSVQGEINCLKQKVSNLESKINRLEGGIEMALSKLGVPGPETPSPVVEAVTHLQEALG